MRQESSLLGEGCCVYSSLFSSILGHYPLGSTSILPVGTTKNDTRRWQMPSKIPTMPPLRTSLNDSHSSDASVPVTPRTWHSFDTGVLRVKHSVPKECYLWGIKLETGRFSIHDVNYFSFSFTLGLSLSCKEHSLKYNKHSVLPFIVSVDWQVWSLLLLTHLSRTISFVF